MQHRRVAADDHKIDPAGGEPLKQLRQRVHASPRRFASVPTQAPRPRRADARVPPASGTGCRSTTPHPPRPRSRLRQLVRHSAPYADNKVTLALRICPSSSARLRAVQAAGFSPAPSVASSVAVEAASGVLAGAVPARAAMRFSASRMMASQPRNLWSSSVSRRRFPPSS